MRKLIFFGLLVWSGWVAAAWSFYRHPASNAALEKKLDENKDAFFIAFFNAVTSQRKEDYLEFFFFRVQGEALSPVTADTFIS